jgi:hypothetical protein
VNVTGLLFRSACGSCLPRARPWPPTLLAAAVILPAVLWLNRDAFDRAQPILADTHAALSLEIAVNQERFGQTSAVYDDVTASVRGLLRGGTAALSERVLDLPGRVASAQDYAAGLKPYLNNENSLLLLDRTLLRLVPELTLGGLVRGHAALRAACLAVFALLLLRAGCSPLVAGAALHLGLLVVSRLGADYPVSVYPLLGPAALLYLAVLGLALAAGAHRRAAATAAALAGAGVTAGWLVNLRTSYAPLAAALLLLYLLCAALDVRRRGASWGRAGLLACLGLTACAGGYRAFTAAWIEPLQGAAAGCPYAHHVIGHPLVLALAVPPNDLARREGIAWEDPCGLKLARRIAPHVRYLDAQYDAALLTYYGSLWCTHPGEMAALYAAKLDIAGVGCYASLGAFSRCLCWPLRVVPHGILWLAVFTLGAALPLLLGHKLGVTAAFTLSGLAATAGLLMLEAALLLPDFRLPYHSLLLYCVLLAGLLPYQAALAAITRRRTDEP